MCQSQTKHIPLVFGWYGLGLDGSCSHVSISFSHSEIRLASRVAVSSCHWSCCLAICGIAILIFRKRLRPGNQLQLNWSDKERKTYPFQQLLSSSDHQYDLLWCLVVILGPFPECCKRGHWGLTNHIQELLHRYNQRRAHNWKNNLDGIFRYELVDELWDEEANVNSVPIDWPWLREGCCHSLGEVTAPLAGNIIRCHYFLDWCFCQTRKEKEIHINISKFWSIQLI